MGSQFLDEHIFSNWGGSYALHPWVDNHRALQNVAGQYLQK